MNRFFVISCLLTLFSAAGVIASASIARAEPQLLLCAASEEATTSGLNAPVIQKLRRSERKDGVWHDVFVKYQGKPKQKLTLTVSWEAYTPDEDGDVTTTRKSQLVRTDAKGNGRWKMEIKGYPAGDMLAGVQDENGQISGPSPIFNVPWIY